MTTHDRIDIEHDEQTAEAHKPAPSEQAPGFLQAEPGVNALPREEQVGGEPAGAVKTAEAKAAAAEAKAATAEERAAQAHDRWLRSQAELDNVRKRTARELAEGLKYANERLVKELLPVLDNLERALVAVDAAAERGESAAALRDGVSLTHAQLLGALKKFGVEPVEALGRPFDPTVHEAIQQVESDQPAGTVVAEHQRGYLLNGRLVRPALVGVAAPRGRSDQSEAAG